MNILNVLTVEDELPMRQELELYPWESWGCIHAGSCSNGKEALNFCRNYKIDLVISDITMPLIDGIELTQILYNEFPNIKIILLTCHEDFLYVKEALRLQAIDYILKMDLSSEILLTAINKVREKLFDENSLQTAQKNKIRYHLTKILAKCLPNKETFEESLLEKELLEINYSLPQDGYDFLLFIHDSVNHWLFIQEEVSVLFENEPIVHDWFVIQAGLYYLSLSTRNPFSLSQFMEKFSENLCRQSYLNVEPSQIYIYSMETNLSFKDIVKVMSDCMDIENYHFYYPNQNIIYKTQLFECHNLAPEIKEHFYQLINAKLSDPDELISVLHKNALSVLLYPEQFKALIAGWIKNTIKPDFSNNNIYNKVKTYNSIDKVLGYIHHHLLTKDNLQIRHEIKKAIDIINLKYASPLSLSYVAEQVGLSSPYLSKIFNLELGESFNEYLTRIRMEQADKLIKESNQKMYQIAELVGIPNYRYFSKLYKKWKENSHSTKETH